MTSHVRRGHGRTESVVVVAVDARAGVVAHARRHVDDHPAFGARTVPVEGERLKVFEGGEAVEFVAHFVVRHNRIGAGRVRTVGRNLDGHSLDAAGTHLDVFLCVAVAVVGAEEEADVAPVGIISDVLHVVIDGDRIVVVNQHGL